MIGEEIKYASGENYCQSYFAFLGLTKLECYMTWVFHSVSNNLQPSWFQRENCLKVWRSRIADVLPSHSIITLGDQKCLLTKGKHIFVSFPLQSNKKDKKHGSREDKITVRY